MKKILVFIIIYLLVKTTAYAEDIYDIDKKELKCISKTDSTAEMLKCTNEAQLAWENEINKYYKLISDKLSKTEQIKLDKSQQAWIEYKTNQFILINKNIQLKQGNMYINVASGLRRELIKQRAIELKSFYQILVE